MNTLEFMFYAPEWLYRGFVSELDASKLDYNHLTYPLILKFHTYGHYLYVFVGTWEDKPVYAFNSDIRDWTLLKDKEIFDTSAEHPRAEADVLWETLEHIRKQLESETPLKGNYD